MVAGAAGVSACARALPPAAPAPRGPQQRVRVGVRVGVSQVRVGARGDVVATEGGRTVLRLRSGEAVGVTPDGQGVRASGGGASGQFASLIFHGVGRSGLVTVDGAPYRGAVSVTERGGSVTAVNEVELEDYVQGVVAVEMGPLGAGDLAALEAQAVASRTYALTNLGRFDAQGFDLTAGVSSQAYGGAGRETPEGNRAAQNTAGLVLAFDGDLVTVFFHSTCGYATASPEEVFRSVRPRPYLRSVSDGNGGGYYCEDSPRFRWQVDWAGQQLQDILRTTVPRALGVDASFVEGIRNVEVRATGHSGRATEIRVRVDRGEIPVFGPDVRAVFQTPDGSTLGSTAVQLRTRRDGDRLTGLTAAGAGWGHGVGMCQWGAIGRARAGQDFRTILRAYYPGVAVDRVS